MKSVALVVNRYISRDRVEPVVQRILRWLDARSISACILDTDYQPGGCPVCPTNALDGVDCAFALGGDGTVLSTARMVAPRGIPILGVRLGRLGFLSEIDPQDLEFALEKLEQGMFFLEKRSMLAPSVVRAGGTVHTGICLNEVVISRGGLLRPVELSLVINREHVASYFGDGVIVSTPTGSTAYSFSAGGPLLAPDLNGTVVTPLCAHNLFARPLVVGCDKQISIRVLRGGTGMMAVLDGQKSWALRQGDEVMVQTAPHMASLVRFTTWSFYHVLRQKLDARDA